MFRTCECCGLPITGDSWYIALYKESLNKAVPSEICKDCMTKFKKALKCASVSDSKDSVVMKTDKSILTKSGFVKIVRALLNGETIDSIAGYYGIDSTIIIESILPVYTKIKGVKELTNHDIEKLRPRQMRKKDVVTFKFSDGLTKDMSNFVMMYTRGTWTFHQIAINFNIKESKMLEFLEYYKSTAKGRKAVMETVWKKVYEMSSSIEEVSKDMCLDIAEALDYLAPMVLSRTLFVQQEVKNLIVQLYNKGNTTKEIASSVGCPYSWVLLAITEWRIPQCKAKEVN